MHYFLTKGHRMAQISDSVSQISMLELWGFFLRSFIKFYFSQNICKIRQAVFKTLLRD